MQTTEGSRQYVIRYSRLICQQLSVNIFLSKGDRETLINAYGTGRRDRITYYSGSRVISRL
jgi:hypothetical protein